MQPIICYNKNMSEFENPKFPKPRDSAGPLELGQEDEGAVPFEYQSRWLGFGLDEEQRTAAAEASISAFIHAKSRGEFQISSGERMRYPSFGSIYEWLMAHRQVYARFLHGYEKEGVKRSIQHEVLGVLQDETETSERREAALGFFLARAGNLLCPELKQFAEDHPHAMQSADIFNQQLQELSTQFQGNDAVIQSGIEYLTAEQIEEYERTGTITYDFPGESVDRVLSELYQSGFKPQRKKGEQIQLPSEPVTNAHVKYEQKRIQELTVWVQRSVLHDYSVAFAHLHLDVDRVLLESIQRYFQILPQAIIQEKPVHEHSMLIRSRMTLGMQVVIARLLEVPFEWTRDGTYRHILLLYSLGYTPLDIAKDLGIKVDRVHMLFEVLENSARFRADSFGLTQAEVVLLSQTGGASANVFNDLELSRPDMHPKSREALLNREARISRGSMREDNFPEVFVSKLIADGYPFVPEGKQEVVIAQEILSVTQEDRDEPEDVAYIQALQRDMADALTTLKTREREILELRFGLIDGEKKTLAEIGKMYGITPGRVGQIVHMGIRHLRHPVRSRQLRKYLD